MPGPIECLKYLKVPLNVMSGPMIVYVCPLDCKICAMILIAMAGRKSVYEYLLNQDSYHNTLSAAGHVTTKTKTLTLSTCQSKVTVTATLQVMWQENGSLLHTIHSAYVWYRSTPSTHGVVDELQQVITELIATRSNSPRRLIHWRFMGLLRQKEVSVRILRK
ncbi:hypothetical protein RRG08_031865 [Elysia crispata]|uniref:Uncharacterized protein n=1 Tax=Elysia crispata TaxID=231223 RepID=A0AAE1AJ00_9GAST|nr:hypothetical protein RRG08_031865 [Elysia crispata]